MVSQFKKYITSANKLFLIGIFLLPFIYLENYTPSFEAPRVVFFIIWIELVALSLLISNKTRAINNKLMYLLIVFFGYLVIGAFVGQNFQRSLLGNYWRMDGLFTLVHLIAFSVITALVWNNKSLKILTKLVFYSNLILTSFIILSLLLDFVAGLGFQLSSPVGNFFGNPNFLAGYLLITSVFHINTIKTSKLNHKNILYLILLFFIISLTQSRSAVAIYLLVHMSAFASKFLNFNLVKTILILSILFLILFYSFAYTNFDNMQPFESRVRILNKSHKAFLSKPILGWGWANFDSAYESVDWPIAFNNDVYVDKAHSHFLEYLITTGVVGFVLYILIILNTSRILYKNNQQLLLIVFMVFILHSQTNVISIAEEVYFWICTGVALSKS